MLTYIDMMARKVEAALAQRLESLTGDDGICCAVDLQAEARTLRASPRVAQSLARAKAMADGGRMLALALLKRRGELCACELQAALGLSHATVSHHMGVLVEAQLVEADRRGKWMHYRLADDARGLAP